MAVDLEDTFAYGAGQGRAIRENELQLPGRSESEGPPVVSPKHGVDRARVDEKLHLLRATATTRHPHRGFDVCETHEMQPSAGAGGRSIISRPRAPKPLRGSGSRL